MEHNQSFALPVPSFIRYPLEKITGVDGLRKIYHAAQDSKCGENFYEKILTAMGVHIQTNRRELLRIPRKGACIVVANHPFGCVEGIAMAHVLLSLRDDVKIMANGLLSMIPEFHESMYFVNPFGGSSSRLANAKSMKQSLQGLNSGGMLLVFPAGEVSSLSLKTMSITDKEWSTSVTKLAVKTKATVIPAFIHGNNSTLFYAAGIVHSRLRTAMLVNEFLKRKNYEVHVTFGRGIQTQTFAKRSIEELTSLFRYRTYILAHKKCEDMSETEYRLSSGAEIAEAIDKCVLSMEIKSIPHKSLCMQGDYEIYYAISDEIPNIMLEIGRLREISFRLAGEGTGQKNDIDIYDTYYTHLFVWNKEKQEIVGAYRIGRVDEIMKKQGIRGLYSSCLFQYDKDFLSYIPNSLEMGRSFVHPEYQRSYLPMLLLWKGIAAFIAQNPHYHYLFGPVSISGQFSSLSLSLMVETLQKHYGNAKYGDIVQPKDEGELTNIIAKNKKVVKSCDIRSIDELNDIVSDIESDGKGVPTLIRHYLKLGGRIAAFSIDKEFNNCCDGLIVVDLLSTEKGVLAKYMGNLMNEYLLYHGIVNNEAKPVAELIQ